jgi:calcineurin-like phosphoesterase family protein
VEAARAIKREDMRRWVISDTHFGHTMLQKHCRRPADADERIITNWRRLIAPEDMVIHCGDVAFNFVNLKELLDSLPGRKILVRGNHDAHGLNWYMENGFEYACDGLVMSRIYFTHEPEAQLPTGCKFNIHGHLHISLPPGKQAYKHCRLFSLEYTDYQPRIIEKFVRKGQ